MRLLFLTMADIGNMSDRGIYTDLLREFRARGDEVYVVTPSERRHRAPTRLVTEAGISVLRVRTGNLIKVGMAEKAMSTILVERQFTSAIARYFGEIAFDLVLYSTPPVTFDRVVRYIKRRDGCRSYLLLKDIFPQNAVDLGMIRRGGLVWRYFRAKEKRLYALSDRIGCMSPANVRYLLDHNPQISAEKVEECPNSIKPLPLRSREGIDSAIRALHGIPRDCTLLVYGGNLGIPQGLGFLLDVLDACRNRKDIFFLIVGSGTEYPRIDSHLRAGGQSNARLVSFLPKEQYDALLVDCDVGLIFLDPRFTIPNFPARLTAYMEAAMPIIAATDCSTDIRTVLDESGGGIWVRNGDLDEFMAAVNRLSADGRLRMETGRRGRRYLETHFTVARAYDIITARAPEEPTLKEVALEVGRDNKTA